MTNTLLVDDLHTHFLTKAGVVRAVSGVSFAVAPGEILGVVGESGSGKSVTALSIMRLVDPPGQIVGGRILFQGTNLLDEPEEAMRRIRGQRIAMIFQDPMMTLTPILRIETQMIETIQAHTAMGYGEARTKCIDALDNVGISAPKHRLRQYPHELSGGMRQRVVIAIALLFEPDLVIADEPTTALDVTIQAQILAEMKRLCAETRSAMIWITHDLAVVSTLADRVVVMYAGRVVESGPVDSVMHNPHHPYTAGLLNSTPGLRERSERLQAIPGMAPSLLHMPTGCAFRPRCKRADLACYIEPNVTAIDGGQFVRCHHAGRPE